MSCIKSVLIVLLLIVLAACQQPIESDFLLGGIQVNEDDHEHWIKTMKKEGFNTVAVTVYAHQGDWDKDHLWFDEEAEYVLKEIRIAKKKGLRVVMILRHAIDHAFERNRFLWHGMIMPRTDEQVQSWFRQYGEFAHHWARVAEEERVDILGIASEMNALTSTVLLEEIPVLEEYYLNPKKAQEYREEVLEHADEIKPQHMPGKWEENYESLPEYLDDRQKTFRNWAEQVTFGVDVEAMNRRRKLLEAEWIKLIDGLRDIYSGGLTYAANFDQYQEVTFWDRLDYIGVSGYFPLRDELEKYEESKLYPALEEGWTNVLSEMNSFRKETGVVDKPVVLTELGYTFLTDSTIHPWAAFGFSLIGEGEEEKDPELIIWENRPVNYQERALAIRALRQAVKKVDEDLLKGILYWKLSTLEIHKREEPFVMILGTKPPDPMLAELLAFVE